MTTNIEIKICRNSSVRVYTKTDTGKRKRLSLKSPKLLTHVIDTLNANGYTVTTHGGIKAWQEIDE